MFQKSIILLGFLLKEKEKYFKKINPVSHSVNYLCKFLKFNDLINLNC